MATPNEISSRIITALGISEPELDIGVGTPLRKIIDTVSEAIAETTVDAFLTSYQYDIDSRAGADLDAFAAMFGFSRQLAKRANGTILLQRTTPAPESILIPSGSQASTGTAPGVIVRTLVPSVFPRSAVVLEVPVEVIEGGSFGNVAAGSISVWLTLVEGITSITNPAPFVGGSDTETDAQFRDRLRKTIFRNLAGTRDMYIAIGMSEATTFSCKVYGAYERWTERIEIVGGTGSPSIARNTRNRTLTITAATNASPSAVTTAQPHDLNVGDYVWIAGAIGNTAINGLRRIKWVLSGVQFNLEDINGAAINGNGAYTASSATITQVIRMSSSYTSSFGFGADIDFDDIFALLAYSVDFTIVPPLVTVLDPVAVPDGVYEFSFVYTSQGSRNFPNRTTGIIADRVDVWIDGQTVEQASVVAVLDTNNTMNTTSLTYPKGAYRRRDGRYPNPGASADIPIILPLPLTPIIDVPGEITIGNTVYTEGVHYFIVDRMERSVQGSMEARSGLEFVTDATVTGHIQKTMNITGTSDTTPVLVTVGAHSFQVGQRVKIAGAAKTVLNTDWYIEAIAGTTITLLGSTAPGGGAGGTAGTVRLYHPVALDYSFNSAPLTVGRNIEEWRLAGSNVLVHKAQAMPLKFNVAVILQSGYTAASIQSTVDLVVGEVLKAAGIGGVVQLSDVIRAISEVAGVDAVRMLTGSDFTTKTITGAVTDDFGTKVTTSTVHGFVANQLVEIAGVAGTIEINGDVRVASIVDTTHFVVDVPFINTYSGSGATVRSAQFGTHVMSEDGTRPLHMIVDRTSVPPRPTDIQLNDNRHAVLHSVVMTIRAQNTWV